MEVLATLRRFDWPDFGSESGANPPPPSPPLYLGLRLDGTYFLSKNTFLAHETPKVTTTRPSVIEFLRTVCCLYT